MPRRCHSLTITMDSLLCEEDWLSCPSSPPDDQCQQAKHIHKNVESLGDSSEEECLEAMKIFLGKESGYMPKLGYSNQLQSNHSLMSARFRAVQWLIKSCIRMNLSFGIVFVAVNYLDRFLSLHPSKEWNGQMVELLSVTCVSVALKFTETSVPLLNEIQMEGLDHSFEKSTIKRMELILLQELGWHMNSPTPYSYLEIVLPLLDIDSSSTSQQHKDQLTNRVTDLTVGALLDVKLMEYKPSILAVSAIWCSLEECAPSKSYTHLTSITKLINQHHNDDDLVKCHWTKGAEPIINRLCKLMGRCGAIHCPSIPVTILLKEETDDGDDDTLNDCINRRPSSNIDDNPVKKKIRI